MRLDQHMRLKIGKKLFCKEALTMRSRARQHAKVVPPGGGRIVSPQAEPERDQASHADNL